MEFLMKHKKAYLMVGGTLLPAFILKKAGEALGMNDSANNILFVAGAIVGGMITSKMLK
jgi:hypothetical protein